MSNDYALPNVFPQVFCERDRLAARQTLTLARQGANIPTAQITQALVVTGDLSWFFAGPDIDAENEF